VDFSLQNKFRKEKNDGTIWPLNDDDDDYASTHNKWLVYMTVNSKLIRIFIKNQLDVNLFGHDQWLQHSNSVGW